MLTTGVKTLWSNFQDGFADRLDKNIIDIYKQFSGVDNLWPGKKYIVFSICAQTLDGDEANTPDVKYYIN